MALDGSLNFACEDDELEYEIAELDTLWEIGEDCVSPITGNIVSNSEYDAKRKRLAHLRPNSKIFKKVTASRIDYSKVKKVIHDPPMTSIDKASGVTREQELDAWMLDCISKMTLPSGDFSKVFVQSYKHDGVAVSVNYRNGTLVSAGLRPRGGIEGLDITENIKGVKGVPQTLPLAVSCSIRGELECLIPDFKIINDALRDRGDKVFANPRNFTAGTMQLLDPAVVAARRISFTGYSIENLEMPQGEKIPYATEIDRAKWSNKVLKVNFVQVCPYQRDDLDKMEENIDNLPYEVDGVVISVNDLEDQEQLGRVGNKPTGNPRGKIAWKFEDEVKEGVIKSMIWSVGRTGGITPVAVTDPLNLAGTQVRNFSLANIGLACRYNVHEGIVFGGYKSGKIIPTIKYVKDASGKRTDFERDPKKKKLLSKLHVKDVEAWGHFPKDCPVCGKPTTLEQGGDGIELVCENASCDAQATGRLLHYLTIFGVKGIGESQINALRDGKVVKDPADFYMLDVPELIRCGLSERESLLALAAIHMIDNPSSIKDNKILADQIAKVIPHKKRIPLSMLFASFGVSGAGKEAGKAMVDFFGDFSLMRLASETQLAEVEKIGDTTARAIHAYFNENVSLIDNILKFVEPELPKTGKLSGKLFCFSGGFSDGKKHWEKQVEDLGGKTSASISTKTSFLVTEETGTKKHDFANQNQISIISLDDLKKMM